MPSDYADRVNCRGDRFRDGLTRACLYIASGFEMAEADSIVMCGQTPNLEALESFYASCRATPTPNPTAQGFAVATTSAGTTSLNIAGGVRGGNLTVSVAAGAARTAMVLAKTYLRSRPGTAVFLVLPQENERGLWVSMLEVRRASDGAWSLPAVHSLGTDKPGHAPETFADESAFLEAIEARFDTPVFSVLGTETLSPSALAGLEMECPS